MCAHPRFHCACAASDSTGSTDGSADVVVVLIVVVVLTVLVVPIVVLLIAPIVLLMVSDPSDGGRCPGAAPMGPCGQGPERCWHLLRDFKEKVIRFIRSSNYRPCSSISLCCFYLFGNSSNRGMSKQYPLTVFLESPTYTRAAVSIAGRESLSTRYSDGRDDG